MPGDQGRDIVTHGSRVVYENRWMRVREDAIERRDGSPAVYGVVDKPDFALIIPMDPGGVWLVEQFRYPVGGRYWEFPQGSWDEDRPGADPAELAAAELREETGLRAARLERLGRIFPAYGFSSQGCQVFLATGLAAGPASPSVEEQDLVARRFTLARWQEMLAGGQIADAGSLAAWALLGARQAAPAQAGHIQSSGAWRGCGTGWPGGG